eukprot:3203103-Rhodomonas_salina.1
MGESSGKGKCFEGVRCSCNSNKRYQDCGIAHQQHRRARSNSSVPQLRRQQLEEASDSSAGVSRILGLPWTSLP